MQKSFLQNWRKNILDKYKVKVNPRAIRELDDIYEYIANEKLVPEIAKGQVDRIKKAILGLDTFPQSHQERNEGRYAGKAYRQLLIDNYIAIFRIDEPHNSLCGNNTISGTKSIKQAPNDAVSYLVLVLTCAARRTFPR